MTAPTTIIDVMEDPALFQPWFRDTKSWRPWKAFLRVLFRLRLSAWDLDLYTRCTGRAALPEGRIEEAWVIVGRRGGKSLILALIGVYLAAFVDWSPCLVAGELALIRILAADRRQARAIYGYARAMLERVPLLAGILQSTNDEEIALSNGITIEIATGSWRTIRGATIIAALCDEIAFWMTGETVANPDREILAAIRPAMATIPHPLLVCAGSPHAKRGEMWDAFVRWFGKGPVLVWKADTLTMRPSLPRRIIDEAFERDAIAAASEYGRDGDIAFRDDLGAFLDRALIEAAIDHGVAARAPVAGIRYAAFCDASSGRGDSFVVAVSYRDGKKTVLAAVSEWHSPFNAAHVVGEAAAFLRGFGCHDVTGDKYAVGFVASLFAEHSIRYRENIVIRGPGGLERALDRSGIYLAFLPLLTSGRVALLDHARMRTQLIALERRAYPSGLDKVNHPLGGHDDVANACAGAVVLAAESARKEPIRIPAAAMRLASTPGIWGRHRAPLW